MQMIPMEAKMRVMFSTAVMLFLAAVTGTADAGNDQIEPKAGTWKTWVISSGHDFRAPPPPDVVTTTAEISELNALAKQRDGVAKDLIAYWDVGPLSLAGHRA